MSYTILAYDDSKIYNLSRFLVDKASDIKDLPTDCAPGSKAIVAENGAIYLLNNKGEWKKQLGSSGGEASIKVDSALSTTSTNPVQNKVITTALSGKANTADLATVATSGSYADLTNKPTIPEVMVVTVTGNDTDGYTADKTFAEIKAVADAGGVVLCNKPSSTTNMYYHLYSVASSSLRFNYISHTNIGTTHRVDSRTIHIGGSNNKVTCYEVQIQSTNNRVTEITSASTDNQYPSAKAVYDFVTSTETDTTYTLSMSGNVITLTPSSGTATSITLPVYNGGIE